MLRALGGRWVSRWPGVGMDPAALRSRPCFGHTPQYPRPHRSQPARHCGCRLGYVAVGWAHSGGAGCARECGWTILPRARVRALALVWLVAGLRSDALVRLRLGCIRWQRQEGSAPVSAQETVSQDALCLLDVPTHKTGSAFTKPVDPLVGRAIAAWEALRPVQPPLLDRRTGESVPFLFCYRARRVAKAYLNHGLIPAL
jgi:hypothetical protein